MISHYRLVRRLGSGGMGEVYLAEDTHLERLVALKLMSAELAKEPNQHERFRSEAKASSALNHPNICVIYEVGETAEGQPYLTMEFIDGQTLELVTEQRRMAIPEILLVGIQTAEALEAAHDRRIVHRDIKPGNIMLDQRGQVKVLDFGLAKRFAQDGASLSSGLTQTGMLIGTPYYMSPEQVLGYEVDHRSDIFSLGVVLYELVAGQKPFVGKTVGETTNNIVNRRPDSLALETQAFSPALDKIIFKCLEKEPANRYAAAREIAADLARLKEEPKPVAAAAMRNATPPVSPGPSAESTPARTKLWQLAAKANRLSNRSTTLIATVVLLLAAAALGFYLADGQIGWAAFSIVAAGILAFAGYWWFVRRTRPGERRAGGLLSPSFLRSTTEDRRAFSSQGGEGGTSAVHQHQAAHPQALGSSSGGGIGPEAQQRSLAVLPFANFSADKDSDYLSDGLTEEITSALSRLPGLKVAARNSAFAFKGRSEDARKIGEALRVTMLLEGSVRKSGLQIRVTAQLINAADGYHVWSETFDRDVSNVIAVQDEIARRLAERLRMEIGAETQAAMTQRSAVHPEAHVLYLQARHFWNKRTRADIEEAVRLYRNAIDLDPTYADAHAGLGAAYVVLPGYAYRPASEYLPLARSAAARALELDPTSALAHAVLGDAATQVGNFDVGMPHLRRAIELNPSYATGHQWYGAALVEMGQMDEALAEYRKAEELDPLSPIIRACIPEWFYFAGRNDEAIAEAKKAIELFPEFPTLRKFIAEALLRRGSYREALEHVQQARASTPGAPTRLDLLAFCEARLGNEAQARQALAGLEDLQQRGYDVDEEIGYACLGLREYERAVEAFERFASSGILIRSSLRNPLLMDELRDHPRFQALLRKTEFIRPHVGDKTQAISGPNVPAVAPGPARASAIRGVNPALVVGAVLVVGLLILGSWRWLGARTSSTTASNKGSSAPAPLPSQRKSVAVLPFDNLSAEKETDYLSDGLTEEITAALSRLPGLKVVGRNSAFAFKGRGTDLRKVGSTLGVATLLKGSLRKNGDQVRVTAHLISSADGAELWSETYDRSVKDLITVQEDIAGQIADRLQARSASLKRQAVAPEAHQLYLQGRVFWNKRTEAGLRKAIDLFQQAIEKDPSYAAAHAALGSSYMLLPQYSEGVRASQYRPLVRAAVNRALELDPSCAEAHAVLAMLLNYERQRQQAEVHFRRALELDPNYATGHHWYGLCLELCGRREQGLAELQKALDLDPLSPIIHTTIPEWYYLGRDYDRAITEARKVIDTFPDFPTARLELIQPLIQKGQLAEAMAEIEKARQLQPDHPVALLHFKGYCLARLGREAEARQILAELDQLRQQGKAVEGEMAMVHQGLREYDKMFELAEQLRLTEGVDEEILSDPKLDEVRHLPQFLAFLQRAGLTNSPAE
jgi:TolB-like protein/Flp pilus assembly protein TadD